MKDPRVVVRTDLGAEKPFTVESFDEHIRYLGTLRIARICKEQVTARLGEGWAK